MPPRIPSRRSSEWFDKHSPNWEASYSVKLLARLEANVFPWLGHRPIRDIKAPELLSVLRGVESRGVLETAHRLMNASVLAGAFVR